MQNELKTFLEEERKEFEGMTWIVPEPKWLQGHDKRLVNKVLEIVKKEIDKRYEVDYNMQDEPFIVQSDYNRALQEVEALLDNLKI